MAIPTVAEQVWRGRLAYAAQTADGLTIHVLAAGDDQPQALIPGYSPVWSPDGSQIAFVSERNGVAQVYRINATGQSLTQLTHGDQAKSDPAWSPQAGSLAFLAHTGDETALQLVDALGTSTRELSDPTTKHVENFSWAPDGQELLFDAATDSGHEIWRVSADGSGLSRFTNLNAQEPSWSPDGLRIAFTSEDGIYVVDRAGTNLRRLTTFSGAQPSWSPDSRRISFCPRQAEEALPGLVVDECRRHQPETRRSGGLLDDCLDGPPGFCVVHRRQRSGHDTCDARARPESRNAQQASQSPAWANQPYRGPSECGGTHEEGTFRIRNRRLA